jgi:hypothetical protein
MSTDLLQAAKDVITLFNAPGNDYVPLLQKMEYNVVLKRVLFPDSVQGIGDVTGYLNFHMFGRKPKLVNSDGTSPYNYGALTAFPPNSLNATTGQVSGTGNYLDDFTATSHTSTPINFTLGFVRKSTDQEWSLISSFATLTGATTTITP